MKHNQLSTRTYTRIIIIIIIIYESVIAVGVEIRVNFLKNKNGKYILIPNRLITVVSMHLCTKSSRI